MVGWTVLGGLVPGLGLLAAGRRRAGTAVLVGTVGLAGAGTATVLLSDPVRLGRGLIADPDRFVLLATAFGLLALGWAVVVVGTHTALRRTADLTRAQGRLGTVLVCCLVVLVAVPTAIAGTDALAARQALTSVFGEPGSQLAGGHTPRAALADPWTGIPRMNVVLMGGDSGADRTGVRPDTLMVASIDTATGDTVLISLPRNLQRVPFPPGSPASAEYPDGFHCVNRAAGTNTECLLNGLWQWGDEHRQYYPGDSHPGLTATVQGIEQSTGLQIDDYVMLNLAGFQQLVDILGGLTVNVTERLPVGGNVEHPVASRWLEPGRRRLSGYLALWYARSRWSTTDYDRMRRQRCVIADLVDQIDPVTVALRFSRIATALKENLQTSISLNSLDAWVTLAQRVKRSHLRSLAFTDRVIDTVRPDFPRMHALVAQALAQPPAGPPAAASPTDPDAASPTTPTTAGASPPSGDSSPAGTSGPATGTAAPVQDVTQVC